MYNQEEEEYDSDGTDAVGHMNRGMIRPLHVISGDAGENQGDEVVEIEEEDLMDLANISNVFMDGVMTVVRRVVCLMQCIRSWIAVRTLTASTAIGRISNRRCHMPSTVTFPLPNDCYIGGAMLCMQS
jgi:hypothetical protein